jgi:transposase
VTTSLATEPVKARATDQVRRDEWNRHERSHTPRGRWVKGTRWSLLKAPANRSIYQLATLAEVQRENRRLYCAFLLREELRLLYHLDDPALAPEHLDAWLVWATRSRYGRSCGSRAPCASTAPASLPPFASASATAASRA